ncbi:MAG: GNAT family N-acetyltransferase [Candidatus Hodarchaeota archaeon]
MVNIIYRNYEIGDDEQLADLFNKAFQMNDANYLRTKENLNWRYVQYPGFEPEMVQVAEDVDNMKIVGAVYVNPVDEVILNDKICLIGSINDVSCHPSYIKKGIASNLMKMAIDYMNKKKCDISVLLTDYNGFPRKKIYSKFGYIDIDKAFIFINFPNIFQLIKNIPGFLFSIPFLFIISYLPRIITRVITKLNSQVKRFYYKITYNTNHIEYARIFNNIIRKYYTGIPIYNVRKIIWTNIKVPEQKRKPTYITIHEGEKIIGGSKITQLDIYAKKFGIRLSFGIIHEIFLDKSRFNSKRSLKFGYKYLIDKILKAATRRSIAGLLFVTSSIDLYLINILTSMFFIKMKSVSVMAKFFNKNFENFKLNKPIYIPTYNSFSIP